VFQLESMARASLATAYSGEQPYAYHAGPDGVKLLEFRHETEFDVEVYEKDMAQYRAESFVALLLPRAPRQGRESPENVLMGRGRGERLALVDRLIRGSSRTGDGFSVAARTRRGWHDLGMRIRTSKACQGGSDNELRAEPSGRLALAACLWAVIVCAVLPSCHDDRAVELVGTLERTPIELLAPISETIIEISVDRGEEVERGQSIVRLDPTLASVELRRAEAAVDRRRSELRMAEHELRRAQKLRQNSVASEQAFERAELEEKEAEADLRQAEADVEDARKHLLDLDLHAPRKAVVDQLPYEVGERVPAGAVLAILLRIERPWVRVWLPEPYLAQVRPGLEVEISLDGWPEPVTGQILDIAREPTFTPHFALTERERAHLVYETRVEIMEGAAEIRPGVPATVRLPFAPARSALSGWLWPTTD
jgi:HlyD family secretion protein